jgi:hypothetical protein
VRPVETIRRNETRIGPNDPCICGSGRKYKKCCGRGMGGPGPARGSRGPMPGESPLAQRAPQGGDRKSSKKK